jgi:hypothetical protein
LVLVLVICIASYWFMFLSSSSALAHKARHYRYALIALHSSSLIQCRLEGRPLSSSWVMALNSREEGSSSSTSIRAWFLLLCVSFAACKSRSCIWFLVMNLNPVRDHQQIYNLQILNINSTLYLSLQYPHPSPSTSSTIVTHSINCEVSCERVKFR